MFGGLKKLTCALDTFKKRLTKPYSECLGVPRGSAASYRERRTLLKDAQLAYEKALKAKGPGGRCFVVDNLVDARNVVNAVLGAHAACDMDDAGFMELAVVCRNDYFEKLRDDIRWQDIERPGDFVEFALACRWFCEKSGV
ncbi:MAG: hypothetical protein JXB25_09300 [Deltaproteobacteria bacterium]|nr:hypothetical protein [Deltaproteobacteria bacterium]